MLDTNSRNVKQVFNRREKTSGRIEVTKGLSEDPWEIFKILTRLGSETYSDNIQRYFCRIEPSRSRVGTWEWDVSPNCKSKPGERKEENKSLEVRS